MANSPIVQNADLVTFTIKSEGSAIPTTYQVISIKVERMVNRIPICEIELVDGNPAKEDFPISDSDTFVPGNKIEVEAGYESQNETIFEGVVMAQSMRINSQRGPTLIIECKDNAVKMTVGRKNAYYQNTTDSDIMSKLISDSGLSADVSSTSNELKEVIQYYATDWDFLVSRAEINGMVVMVNNGTVAVKSPNDASDTVLTLTYGFDIYNFNATLDAQNQYKTVKSNAWDYSSQAITNGEASISNASISNLSSDTLSEVIGLSDFDLQTAGFVASDGLNTWAEGLSVKSKFAKVQGSLQFQGSAAVLPGTQLEIKGVGTRFSGTAYVSGVVQTIEDGNWFTTAQLGLSPEWFSAKVRTEAPVAAGLLPGIQGLQVGKVKQIYEDPDNELRVLVTLPLIQSGDDGVWARLATFYATSGAGAFFYPEVDDEVVVGFFNDDPRYPVILGSMYSSGRAPAYQPEEENNTKAIVSREQLKIIFDEEKKVITIQTPASNMIVLSDEDQGITISDQNGNSIKLSPSGIDISSASNITVSADESISMTGTTGITMSASGGDISASAMNISCTADLEFSASADASTSISSSGELSINGTMVLINS